MELFKAKMPDATFLEIWDRAESPADVAAATGYSEKVCRTKAYKLRRRGYIVKKFPVGFQSMPKEKLIEISRQSGLRVSKLYPLTPERGAYIRSKIKRESLSKAGKLGSAARRMAREAGYPTFWERTRDFIEIWEAAENIEEVAAKSGRTVKHCRANASRLRAFGVSMKYIPKTCSFR